MRKIIGLLLMGAVLLFTFSSTIVAEASYDSKATITFIKGLDQETEDESDNIPDGIVEESQPAIDSDLNGNMLPTTATNNYSFLLIGLIVFILGISFLMFYKRAKNEKVPKV